MDNFILTGDITPKYNDERCVLYNEDCVKVLEKLPDNSIDLIVSDVPYRIIIGSRCSKKQGNPAKNQRKTI